MAPIDKHDMTPTNTYASTFVNLKPFGANFTGYLKTTFRHTLFNLIRDLIRPYLGPFNCSAIIVPAMAKL